MSKSILTPKIVNEEASQSFTRLAISGFGVGVFLIQLLKDRSISGSDSLVVLAVVGTYFLLSLPWYFWVRQTPNRYQNRRHISVFADLFLTTFALHFAGAKAPFFYIVYLWVIVGNGLRFGPRFLMQGLVTGFVGFGSLLLFNPFWQANLSIGYGLLTGIVVLPLFYLKILNRTHQLNLQLEEELEKSKAAEKAKGEFVANMSHEIRTPMNGVLGMVEVLGDTELNEAQRGHLDIIQRSADSLLNILNDILDYSKISSGKMEIEDIPLDLKETLQDVVRLLQPTADDKAIALTLDYPDDQPKVFLGDPTRIRQIIFNLVGNGLKFTDEGSVVLRCRCSKEFERHNVAIEIEDTGIGIPENRLEQIFEQFEQAESGTTRKFGGTGLGLAICRQLALIMKGEVTVRSVLGKGTVFFVSLTLPFATEQVCSRSQLLELPDYELKALVAEDNTVNQLVVRKLLAKVGISIELANNGQEAVDMLAAEKYDLVFMDVRMPVMNGTEATRVIRASQMDQCAIPIIALTADASVEDARRCLDAGMDYHLRKPLKLEELVVVVDNLLSSQAVCDTV